ncbi:hypothetical protein C2E23DRAFT_824096 [Lenzites betulinus]|nr:hypothetical protein C2E23DRAFT_824096 [Lenzites betulinus]
MADMENTGIQFVSDVTCSNPGCGHRNIASRCTFQLCKPCCLERQELCAQPSHRHTNQHITQNTTLSNPAALTSPPPVVPLRSAPVSQSTATATPTFIHTPLYPPPTHQFRAQMPPEFEKEWDRLAEAERESRAARQLRRANLTAFKHSVELVVWLQDGQPPDIWDLQGIVGFPTLNFAQQSDHHLLRLQMERNGQYEQWIPRASTWRATNVDLILKVRSRQKMVMRKLGVKTCIQFEDIVQTTDDPLCVYSPSPGSALQTPGRKRPAAEPLPDDRHRPVARQHQEKT